MEPLLRAASFSSASFVSALFSAIWEGAILAVCVLLCLRLLPRLSAASRSFVWLNVFLLAVLLHLVPSFTARLAAGSPAPVSRISLDVRWSAAFAAAWAMLSLWRGTQLILSAIRLHRLAGRAVPVDPDPELLAILEGNQSGGQRSAQLCASTEVERPSVFGFLRPRILVPPVLLERLSAQELRQVVLHEMEHLRRGDDWTNLLQKIALALFPLNPVLIWVERRLCAERELACDDHVLRSSGGRKAYAICLTRLAEFAMLRGGLSLALGAWERRSELSGRVHRLLRRPGKPMGGRQAALVTGSLLAVVFGGALVLARTPQLVSFAPPAQAAAQARSIQPSGAGERNLRADALTGPNLRTVAASPEHVKLVKASVSQRPALSTRRAKPARSNAATPGVMPDYSPDRQAWMVLTDWSGAGMPQSLVFAVVEGDRITYAAVPLENGWLIVQI